MVNMQTSEVGTALAALHEMQLVHSNFSSKLRDLKVTNAVT
jgi:hypothetical protein